MFQTSKLIGTPRASKDGQTGHRSLEFTPIGRAKPRAANESRFNEEDKENDNARFILAAKGFNPDRLNNGLEYDATIDNTEEFSTIGNSPFKTFNTAPEPSHIPHYTNTNEVSIAEGNHHLLMDGATSINEQQHKIKQLNNENINLKVEIRHLRDLLQKIPDDQVNLVEVNIRLEEKLGAATNEINELRNHVKKLTYDVNDQAMSASELQREQNQRVEEANHYAQQLQERYEALLAEKDEDINNLRDKAGMASEDREAMEAIRMENERLRSVQLENDKLRAQITALRDSDDKSKDVNEERVQDLYHERDEYRHKLDDVMTEVEQKDQRLKEVFDLVEDLKLENSQWKDRYERLNDQLQQMDMSRGSRDELSDSKHETGVLRSKVEELEQLNERMAAKLERSQRDLHDALESSGKDNSQLLRQVHDMEEELKDHHRIESDLRAQINSLIKNRSNDNKYEVYEAQIESLSNNESKLMDLNKKLTSQVARLKDEIYHLTSSSSSSSIQTQSLQRQNQELKERLSGLENELMNMEESNRGSDKQMRALQKDMNYLEKDYQALKEENASLVEQIRSQAKNSTDSALSELDKFNLRRLELNCENMEQEIDSLNNTINKLKHELDMERESNHSDELQLEIKRLRRELETSTDSEQIDQLSSEIRRLKNELKFANERSDLYEQQLLQKQQEASRYTPVSDYRPASGPSALVLEQECHRLSLEKDQLLSNLKDMENRYRNLQSSVISKDDMLDRLEIQLKELKRSNKSSFSFEEEEKTSLMKAKAANESRVKQLEIEKESIQRDFDFQIQHYKSRIDDLMKGNSIKTDSGASEPVITLLEKRLEEANKTKNELIQKSNDLANEQAALKAKTESAQKEAAHLLDVNAVYEQNEKLMKLEISQLELKNKTVTEELDQVTQHCRKLVSKLAEVKRGAQFGSYAKFDNQMLQRKIDDLNMKLAETHIGSPTPGGRKKTMALEGQLKYYRAKLYDLNLKANDLEFMYNFVIDSVKSSKGTFKDSLFEFSKLGIYPDYQISHKKKPTFAVVAKLVLAMVRMKRRSEKADKRKKAIEELKHDLDRS